MAGMRRVHHRRHRHVSLAARARAPGREHRRLSAPEEVARAHRRSPCGEEGGRGDPAPARAHRHPNQQRRHQHAEAQFPGRHGGVLEPDRRDQPLGDVLLLPRGAAGDAQAQGRPRDQRRLLGRPLREHAHRPRLQRHQARRGRAHRVDQHGRVHERPSRHVDPAGRGRDPDPREAPGAAVSGRARPHAAGGGPGQDRALRRHAGAARVRHGAHHRADLEPLLPRRTGNAQVLVFARVALPFIAGYFLSYVYRMVNAVLGPTLAAEFGLGPGGLGLLSAVYFLSFALFQLPLGLLLDRFGPRRVNATLLLVAALGGLWFAFAHSAASAIGARALIGLGVSGCLMASFTAFVLWYPADRLSTMNGITFSAGALGAIAATVPLELLLRVLHWREAFLLLAAATVLASLLLWFWVPERAGHGGAPLGAQLRELGTIFRDPAFRRVALCLGASQSASVALQTLWIATWLRDVAGYDRQEVALGLLIVNLGMIVGFLGFGRAADRFARAGRSAFPLIVGGVAVASLCLALIAFGPRAGMPVPALALWFVF